MALKQSSEAMVRRYDYDDRSVIVIDLGPAAEPSVDVVGDTAIVVIGDDQHDIDLPEGAVEAFNRNGVVTIEVEQ